MVRNESEVKTSRAVGAQAPHRHMAVERVLCGISNTEFSTQWLL